MKKKEKVIYTPAEEVEEIRKQYLEKVETEPEYSLEVDPKDVYGMTPKEKEFIKYYCEFKNIPLAAQLCDIDEKEAKSYWASYGGQREISRINKAMYMRQFSNKMLSIDEIGGYLTSLLMDETPIADRIPSKEKLQVAKMLIDINNLKSSALQDPSKINYIDVESQIKDLSAKSIKELINNASENEEKEKIINEFSKENELSAEEVSYLKTLSLKELSELVKKETTSAAPENGELEEDLRNEDK